LETALAAAGESALTIPNRVGRPAAQVLVLSGTGSCCYGKNTKGKTAKIGGWGHLLGDGGSAYQIGLSALRAVVHSGDCGVAWPKLGESILRSLLLNEPEALVDWAQGATKAEIAALAVDVFDAWKRRDQLAGGLVAVAADGLAADAVACAGRLAGRGAPARFILAGGTLLKQPRFAKLVSGRIRKLWPRALVVCLERESVWGAVELARRLLRKPKGVGGRPASLGAPQSGAGTPPVAQSLRLSPTERRNPGSLKLDRLAVSKAVELMLSEDARVPRALWAQRRRIEQAVKLIVTSLRRGGRLFCVGAGTSGRLGALDAIECPPTFRTPPEMVQAIMAGGQTALWRAVEGAEDDSAAGARAIQFRRINSRDVVVGIAAGGRTPFVWGALLEAKRRGATTILLTFNPFLDIAPVAKPSLIIAPKIGPEVLTGSTRLKAGTATKLILNIFTTLAMVKLGKVVSNLMVDLKPSNAKLRDRAVRIVQALTGADHAAAQSALEQSGWAVKDATARLRRRQWR
jgi:N-acetylmuramic acid 6-phosphate etherase